MSEEDGEGHAGLVYQSEFRVLFVWLFSASVFSNPPVNVSVQQ